MPEPKPPKRPPQKSIIVEARMHRNHKLAELPNDAARWAWIIVLLEAKWQKPEGQFSSLKHLKACVGPTAARYVQAMKDVGLLDSTDGAITVHDWRDYQTDTSTERWRRWKGRHLQVVGEQEQT